MGNALSAGGLGKEIWAWLGVSDEYVQGSTVIAMFVRLEKI